jgi:anti-sigma factor RsiW
MTTEQDYRVAIGAYVLGGLQPDEATELENHLDGCPDCQRELAEFTDTAAQLAMVPPELLVETLSQQPPPWQAPAAHRAQADDLILQRTLREIRAERTGARRRRVLAVAAGLVALVAAPVITAVAVDGGSGGTTVAQPPPASTAPAGEVVQGSDRATGVSGRATLAAAPWGTKLQAMFTGEPRGEKCHLFVVSTSGERQVAANWTVTAAAAAGAGTNVQGSVSIPKADIARLEVRTFAGRQLLTINT